VGVVDPNGRPAFAQNADNIADREVQRRQAGMPAGRSRACPGQDRHAFRKITPSRTRNLRLPLAICPTQSSPGDRTTKRRDGACKSGTVLAEARHRAGRLRRGGGNPE